MFPHNITPNLPEWYRLERETEKTIGKLASLKELDYYLRNPDEYIRRLAIIRLSDLSTRDCENLLREIMEDHNESNQNKELAAWVLKSLSLKYNIELFINNRYLTKFTGYEKLSELYKITFNDTHSSIKLKFPGKQISSQIPGAEENLNYERNFDLSNAFDLKLWLNAFASELLKGLANSLKSIPKLLKRKKKRSSKPENHIYQNRSGSACYISKDLMPLVMKSRQAYPCKPSVFSGIVPEIKKVVFNMLYVLFFPVRLILKHKAALILLLLAVYAFFNFTSQGNILFKEYTGKDFPQFQSNTIDTVKQFSISTWNGFKDITGLEGAVRKIQPKTSDNIAIDHTGTTKYSVAAEKGLNIRKAPGSKSEKLSGGPLGYGSVVTFLDRTETDLSGADWYYIKTEDGRSGWVSSKYLILKKEG